MVATLVNQKPAVLILVQHTQLDVKVTVGCRLWFAFEGTVDFGKLWALDQDSSKVQGFGKVAVGWERCCMRYFSIWFLSGPRRPI